MYSLSPFSALFFLYSIHCYPNVHLSVFLFYNTKYIRTEIPLFFFTLYSKWLEQYLTHSRCLIIFSDYMAECICLTNMCGLFVTFNPRHHDLHVILRKKNNTQILTILISSLKYIYFFSIILQGTHLYCKTNSLSFSPPTSLHLL